MSSNRFPAARVAGFVAPGFESVRTEFENNFRRRGERSAACALFLDGRRVVDLWGGYRDREGREPRQPDTLTLAFSVTKGMAAAALAVAHSRGCFHLDEPVATYWPEFRAAGKAQITVRQLLAHQAGLVGIDRRLSPELLGDLDALAGILARQRPLWRPGSRHGYHTLTIGWYQNELLRRTDPRGRSLREYFRDEVATPLGIDFWIGLPPAMPAERVSETIGFHRVRMLAHLHELPPAMVLAGMWPRSLVARSVGVLPLHDPAAIGEPPYCQLEIPAAVGFGTARGVARVYEALASRDPALGISPATYGELLAPPELPARGGRDAIMKLETKYGCGFSRPSADLQFGSDASAFGCPGAGGSFGFADPSRRLGYCYLTSQMGFRLFDDPREKAVRMQCYESLRQLAAPQRAAA